jgi:hypothetical protein
VGSDKAPPKPQTGDDLYAIGLRWHYAINARKGRPKT